MSKQSYWYFLLFIVSVLVQVLFMNNIQFSGYVNPYFYVLFLLLLPVGIARYKLLLLGFILGLSIDVFSNTPGIHASASVFLAFLRPLFLNASSVEENERYKIPTMANMGLGWFVKYSIVLILAHHVFLFFVEMFSFQSFLQTFMRSILSSIFTFIFILISQFLVFRK